MALAIFDLDNTLLEGDSDNLWGQYMVEAGLVDGDDYAKANERFYRDYCAGCLNIQDYLRFSLAPLARYGMTELHALRRDFVDRWIAPKILPAAVELIDRHRAKKDRLLIITATPRFVAEPIAERLAIADLLATEVEVVDGRYTGRSWDIPCFQEGKVLRLQRWLEETGESLNNSTFYSDSSNDLPLLQAVTRPVAVDADESLRVWARKKGWPLISLRGETELHYGKFEKGNVTSGINVE